MALSSIYTLIPRITSYNVCYTKLLRLPIDPKDIGREYESDVIRINSQSGKGGISYILEQNYGFNLPPKMRENFGYIVKSVSDQNQKELMPNEIYDIFKKEYVNIVSKLDIVEAHYAQKGDIEATVTVNNNGSVNNFTAMGNGRLDACSNVITSYSIHYTKLYE